jgi:hypothetical protein
LRFEPLHSIQRRQATVKALGLKMTQEIFENELFVNFFVTAAEIWEDILECRWDCSLFFVLRRPEGPDPSAEVLKNMNWEVVRS